MKAVACAYPADWAVKETVALPVFTDQIPPKGATGRIDFRLQGLISGLIMEQLVDKDDYWLIINPNRMVAPELLLVPLGSTETLGLEKVSVWFQKVCEKLSGAGAKNFSVAVGDLYRPEFQMKEFSGVLIKCLLKFSFEQVKFYSRLDLAEKLVQELNRWKYHFKDEQPIELDLVDIPEVFGEKQ